VNEPVPGGKRLAAPRFARVYASDLNQGLLFAGVGAILLYLVLPPLALLVQASLLVGRQPPQLSLENYHAVLTSSDLPVLFANTLEFALGGSLIALFFGSLLAWLVERTDARLKSVAYGSAFLALAMPNIIKVIGWVFLLGPNNGILTGWAMSLLGVTSLPFNLFSPAGLVLVNGLNWIPGVLLLMAIPFRSMDTALEEAAATHGASRRDIVLRVTLPLARPAALSVLLLTIVQSLENFDTPAVIGIPGRVYLFSTRIYTQFKQGIEPNFGLIGAYSILLMAMVCAGLWLYLRATGDARRFQFITGKGFRPAVLKLGLGRGPATALVALLPTIVALPLLVLLWVALQPLYTRSSFGSLSQLTMDHFVEAFTRRNIQAALTNSLAVGVSAATVTVLITTIMVWLVLRSRIPGRTALEQLASFTLALPGIVLGVALLRTYLTIPIPLYGTIWLLTVAYVTRGIPYAIRYIHAGLIQINQQLEESARVSGANDVITFFRILIPLMTPALFAAWIWVFLQSVSELSMAIMLVGPDSQVVSSTIFDLYFTGLFPELAAFSVVVALLFAIFSIGAQRISRRWGDAFVVAP
jgi:iron(III) transport system permease protein